MKNMVIMGMAVFGIGALIDGAYYGHTMSVDVIAAIAAFAVIGGFCMWNRIRGESFDAPEEK